MGLWWFFAPRISWSQAMGLKPAGCPQVLLTGKPCRNFQVLVAYSMLQMVREQALLECMSGDAILMVRVSLARSPTRLEPDPCTHLTEGCRPTVLCFMAAFASRGEQVMRAEVWSTMMMAFSRIASNALQQ